MTFQLGDIITNKLKPGPHFMIIEITNKDTVVGLQLDGKDENQKAYFSLEYMWVFKKV